MLLQIGLKATRGLRNNVTKDMDTWASSMPVSTVSAAGGRGEQTRFPVCLDASGTFFHLVAIITLCGSQRTHFTVEETKAQKG